MKKHNSTFRHFHLLGISFAIGLCMLLLVPEQAQAKGRGFGRGYHGGYRGGGRAVVHGRVGGPRAVRGGYGRGFVAGAYAGGGYGYGYGTGYDSTRYAMYSARNPTTDYTGIPLGANPGYITRPGLVMSQKAADQQYLAAVAQARAMEAGEKGVPEGQMLLTTSGTLVRKGVLNERTGSEPTEKAGPPPVGTTFSSLANAQTVTIEDKTYFVCSDVYFQAFYQGSDIVYKVVETPKGTVEGATGGRAEVTDVPKSPNH